MRLNFSAPTPVDQFTRPNRHQITRAASTEGERETECDNVVLLWRMASKGSLSCLLWQSGLQRSRWLKLYIAMFKWRFRGNLDLHLHVNARPRRNLRLGSFIKCHTLCAYLCMPCPHGGSTNPNRARVSHHHAAMTVSLHVSDEACCYGGCIKSMERAIRVAGRLCACVGSAYTYNS